MLHNEAQAATLYNLANIAASTATLTGAAVDVRDVEGDLMMVQDVGAVSGTAPTLDGKIQDSDDGSTGWADVGGAAFTQVTAANTALKIAVSANACKRYIRYVGTIAGTTPSFTLGVKALGRKKTV